MALALNLSRVETAPPETPACITQDGDLVPCSVDRSHLGEYLVRALVGRGVDITATAIAIEAGAVEKNKIQPTVEHRVGISLITVGAQTGACMLIERKAGHKWARRASRTMMAMQFAVGAWNLGQAWKAQRNSSLGR